MDAYEPGVTRPGTITIGGREYEYMIVQGVGKVIRIGGTYVPFESVEQIERLAREKGIDRAAVAEAYFETVSREISAAHRAGVSLHDVRFTPPADIPAFEELARAEEIRLKAKEVAQEAERAETHEEWKLHETRYKELEKKYTEAHERYKIAFAEEIGRRREAEREARLRERELFRPFEREPIYEPEFVKRQGETEEQAVKRLILEYTSVLRKLEAEAEALHPPGGWMWPEKGPVRLPPTLPEEIVIGGRAVKTPYGRLKESIEKVKTRLTELKQYYGAKYGPKSLSEQIAEWLGGPGLISPLPGRVAVAGAKIVGAFEEMLKWPAELAVGLTVPPHERVYERPALTPISPHVFPVHAKYADIPTSLAAAIVAYPLAWKGMGKGITGAARQMVAGVRAIPLAMGAKQYWRFAKEAERFIMLHPKVGVFVKWALPKELTKTYEIAVAAPYAERVTAVGKIAGFKVEAAREIPFRLTGVRVPYTTMMEWKRYLAGLAEPKVIHKAMELGYVWTPKERLAWLAAEPGKRLAEALLRHLAGEPIFRQLARYPGVTVREVSRMYTQMAFEPAKGFVAPPKRLLLQPWKLRPYLRGEFPIMELRPSVWISARAEFAAKPPPYAIGRALIERKIAPLRLEAIPKMRIERIVSELPPKTMGEWAESFRKTFAPKPPTARPEVAPPKPFVEPKAKITTIPRYPGDVGVEIVEVARVPPFAIVQPPRILPKVTPFVRGEIALGALGTLAMPRPRVVARPRLELRPGLEALVGPRLEAIPQPLQKIAPLEKLALRQLQAPLIQMAPAIVAQPPVKPPIVPRIIPLAEIEPAPARIEARRLPPDWRYRLFIHPLGDILRMALGGRARRRGK